MKIINGFHLRIIAMVSMIFDHWVLLFFNNDIALRSLGRFAFPIYALLLADGFLHIKDDENRLKRNISKLLILTFVSEFAYDFAEFGFEFSKYFSSQSVMFTLLLGYLALIATEKFKGHKITIGVAYLLVLFVNYLINGNFTSAGPLLVIAMYWFLKYTSDKSWFCTFLLSVLIFVMFILLYVWGYCHLGDWEAWTSAFVSRLPWIIAYFPIALLISMYNRKLGYHKKWFAILYNYLYPVHLVIFGIIKWVILA